MAFTPYNPYLYQPGFQQQTNMNMPVFSSAPAQTSQQPGFTCRPVTSKEEATAVQVDFFGPGTVMPDLAHGVIYLKRFNSQTGACDIFEFYTQQEKAQDPVQYATMEDIAQLKDEIENLKGNKVKKNDE